ncbi:MAG: O-antigen ligase family protein [Pyrinomonadaceae bacterium]
MTDSPRVLRYLDHALFGSIMLLAIAAPISIAATQTAWALSILFWLARLVFTRPQVGIDSMTVAVLAFVGLTLISSFFSYEPEVSLRKMVAVSLVSIAYLVFSAIKTARAMRTVVAVLILASTVTAIYTIGRAAAGNNLKVVKLSPDSPLRVAGVLENDTIISFNGAEIDSPDELAGAIEGRQSSGPATLRVYRFETYFEYELSSGVSAPQMGILEWSRGRDVRAAGFYGHYTTYAESVQLVGSLALGLLVLIPGGIFARYRVLLAAALLLLGIGLFLTVTRASWAGFALSAAVIVVIGASRKALVICVLFAIPVAAVGLIYLQQKRNVAFVDAKDGSTTWRTTVWREAGRVIMSDPRHLAVGVGMDSIKTHWQEWQMFDNGRLPMGHMHSTPLQFAFERGVPALIAWLVWIFLFFRLLWRGYRRADLGWFERGVLLGCLGGTTGFLASGLVHYNWGDSEVVMIFYLLTGLAISISRQDQIEVFVDEGGRI